MSAVSMAKERAGSAEALAEAGVERAGGEERERERGEEKVGVHGAGMIARRGGGA
jgi:hypothetical protein